MRIITDTTRCVGAGQCVLTAPAIFDQSDDDGTVVVLVEQPDAAGVAAVEEAIDLCPSQAISLARD